MQLSKPYLSRLLLTFLGLLLSVSIFSQGDFCGTSEPFCTGTTATFAAGVNVEAAQISVINQGRVLIK